MGQIILASGSPRRKELLEQLGLCFEVCPAVGGEHTQQTHPKRVVMELASGKAREVAGRIRAYGDAHKRETSPQDILVIGADTVVSVCGQILGKPKDEEDAFRMLSLLSGKTHEVYTGVALVFLETSGRAGEHLFYEKTSVQMSRMDDTEIRNYIATGEPMDKAGAYGIQGKCAVYIDGIEGDYNNVVGLPVAALYRELKKIGTNLFDWQRSIFDQAAAPEG